MLSQQHRAVGLRAKAPRSISIRCRAAAPAQVLEKTRPAQAQAVSEVPVALDVEALNKRLEARAKAMIQLDEQEVASRTKVKFVLKQQVGLGEGWKIVGKCPELGNMLPEVAPYMAWGNGDVWTYEAKIRPGTFVYKAVLRKPDGQYLWEAGKDRVLEVPFEEPTKEVELRDVKFM